MPIIQELAKEALEDKKIIKFKKIFKTYEDLLANLTLDIIAESADLVLNKMERDKVIIGRTKKMNKLQERQLAKKIQLKIKEYSRTHENFIQELELYIPNFFYRKLIVRNFLKKHNERIRKIMMSKHVEFVNLIKD